MQIDEKFSLTKETYCWSLKWEFESGINPKTNLPKVSRGQKFFGKLELALQSYLDDSLKDCEQISEILEAIDKAKNHIDSLVKKMKDVKEEKAI